MERIEKLLSVIGVEKVNNGLFHQGKKVDTHTAKALYKQYKDEILELDNFKVREFMDMEKNFYAFLQESTLNVKNKAVESIGFIRGVVVNDSEKKEFVYINPKTFEVSEVFTKSHAMEETLNKNDLRLLKENTIPVRLVYEPHKEKYWTQTELGMEVININKYLTPKYREVKDDSKEVHPLIDKLFNHLLGKDREDVLAWIHLSLVQRTQSSLLLVGSKGTGKSTLIELIRNLHGESNATNFPEGFATSQFNKYMFNRTLLIGEEVKLDKNTNRMFKRWSNDKATPEDKHVSVDRSESLYCSFIFSSNSYSDIYIESDDRRFSIPDITDKRLDESFTFEEISTLLELIKEDRELKKVYNLVTSIPYDKVFINPIKGVKFNTSVLASLSILYSTLYYTLFEMDEGDEISLSDIHRKVRKTNNGYRKPDFRRAYEKVQTILTPEGYPAIRATIDYNKGETYFTKFVPSKVDELNLL